MKLWSFEKATTDADRHYYIVTNGEQTFRLSSRHEALELSATLNAYELMVPLKKENN